jgi:hypothetical protein
MAPLRALPEGRHRASERVGGDGIWRAPSDEPRMSQDDKPFSVSDRRHFTPDGQPRDDADGSDTPPPQAEAPASAAPSNEQARGGGAVTFSQFLLSLGAQAGMLLAAGPTESKDEAGALEGARSLISILEMLREKTEGRRTADEEQVLEGLLYELRMAYVERSRGARP